MGSGVIRVATVALGLIRFDVGVMGAVDSEDAGLFGVCTHGLDGPGLNVAKLRRLDYCPECAGRTLATRGSVGMADLAVVPDNVRKAKASGGSVVLIDPEALEELAKADESKKKVIDLTPHPAVDAALAFPSGKSYYLASRPGFENNYALVAELLARKPELTWIGEFSFQGAAQLYQLTVSDGVLAMRQLARPETVRKAPQVSGSVNPKWLEMAAQWADTMVTPYDPATYRSTRAAALAKIAAEGTAVALAGDEMTAQPAVGQDLGAMLEAALASAQTKPVGPVRKRPARKAASPAAAPVVPQPAKPVRKRAARKSTAA